MNNGLHDDPGMIAAYLSLMVGRSLSAGEIYEAFGMKKSAYHRAAREGRLINPTNLVKVAAHLGLNPIDLQIYYGLIQADAVSDYLQSAPVVQRTAISNGVTLRPSTKLRDAHPRADLPPA